MSTRRIGASLIHAVVGWLQRFAGFEDFQKFAEPGKFSKFAGLEDFQKFAELWNCLSGTYSEIVQMIVACLAFGFSLVFVLVLAKISRFVGT
jgi:hypothetical protein